MKPKKPRHKRLGFRIRKKIQEVSDDFKQAKKRRKAARTSGGPKDTKAPKKKTTLADKRIERLKPISKKKKAVRSGRMEGRKDVNVKSQKPTFRAKRAERTIGRIEKRKERKAMKLAKEDASGPTSRNKSVAACQKGDKKCSQK
jgi:hypothetical protein